MSSILTLSRRVSPLGVDLGAHGVRIVQWARVRGDYVPVGAAAFEAAAPVVESAPGERAAHLKDCRRLAAFRGRHAILALSSPDVQFYALELPPVTGRELAQVVRFEVERLMTETTSAVETQHWSLPATKVPAPNAIGVAASLERITEQLAICRDAGLTCTVVDTFATALARLGVLLHRWPDDVVWGMLDLSGRAARLVLCSEGAPVLVRVVGTGGQTWTQRVAESLSISPTAADVQKCEQGVAPPARSEAAGEPAVAPSELSAMLLGILRSDVHGLAAEVKRSYEYVRSCYPRKQAADLVLVGGGAGMPNLAAHLAHLLGIPVRGASAYLEGRDCRLRWDPKVKQPFETFAVAGGLAAGDS
ncbi:MAG: pilus assembly protein PilM [Planctomycetes bacterium]|nr:pilus assembly protein PilM [Planctomycetota bacterium]